MCKYCMRCSKLGGVQLYKIMHARYFCVFWVLSIQIGCSMRVYRSVWILNKLLTRLVCTLNLNAFSMLNPNLAMKIWISKIFEKKVSTILELSYAVNTHTKRIFGILFRIRDAIFDKYTASVNSKTQIKTNNSITQIWQLTILGNFTINLISLEESL